MDLVLELGTSQLDVLRKTFLANESLTLLEFVDTMLYLLPVEHSSAQQRVATVQALQEAFAQIDINGDGTLDWEEFMSTLIEHGSSGMQQQGRLNSHSWVEQHELSQGISAGRVSRVRYFAALDLICVCEEGRRQLALYNALGTSDSTENGLHKLGEIDTAVGNLTEGGEVFDVVLCEEHMVLILTVGDFSFQFYDVRALYGRQLTQNEAVERREEEGAARSALVKLQTSLGLAASAPPAAAATAAPASKQKGGRQQAAPSPTQPWVFISRTHVPSPQRLLLWVPEAGLLLSSGLAPEILVHHVLMAQTAWAWEINCARRGSLKAHTSDVTDMVLINDLGLVATSSLDATLCMWGVVGMPDGVGGRRGANAEDPQAAAVASGSSTARPTAAPRSTSMLHVRQTNPPSGGGSGTTAAGAAAAAAAATGLFLRARHVGVHLRGIRTLLYMPTVRLLLSGGFEAHIQVWDMLLDDGIPVYKLLPSRSATVAAASGGGGKNGAAPASSSGVGGGRGGGGSGSTYSSLGAIVSLCSLEPAGAAFDVAVHKALLSGADASDPVFAEARRQKVHYAQMCSVDDRGVFTWWDVSRDTALLDMHRCLQVWMPMSATVSRQSYRAKQLLAIRVPEPEEATAEGSSAGGSPSQGGGGGGSSTAAASSDKAKGVAACGALLLAVGPRLKCFEAVKAEDDRAVASGVLYQAGTMSFVSVSRADIKVYDACTGYMTRVHRAALPSEVTAGCFIFDGRSRKILAGCNTGAVLVLNAFTMKVIKELPGHRGEVSGLVYVAADNTVISTGWDGTLNIHDELLEEDESSHALLRRVRHTHGPGVPISACAFDYTLSIIATSAASGEIKLWDYQDVTLLGTLTGHAAEVVCMVFLHPYPALVSADLGGVINIWHVAPGSRVFQCLASFIHEPSPSSSSPLPRAGAAEVGAPPTAAFHRREAAAQALAALITQHSITAHTTTADMLHCISRVHKTPAGAAAVIASPTADSITAMALLPGKPRRRLQADGSAAENHEDGEDTSRLDVEAEGYPSIIVADDQGRVTVYPTGAVLAEQALLLPNRRRTAPFVIARDAFESGEDIDGKLLFLRGSIDAFPESKAAHAVPTYNPRKMCRRRGGRDPRAAAPLGIETAGAGGPPRPLAPTRSGHALTSGGSFCLGAASPMLTGPIRSRIDLLQTLLVVSGEGQPPPRMGHTHSSLRPTTGSSALRRNIDLGASSAGSKAAAQPPPLPAAASLVRPSTSLSAISGGKDASNHMSHVGGAWGPGPGSAAAIAACTLSGAAAPPRLSLQVQKAVATSHAATLAPGPLAVRVVVDVSVSGRGRPEDVWDGILSDHHEVSDSLHDGDSHNTESRSEGDGTPVYGSAGPGRATGTAAAGHTDRVQRLRGGDPKQQQQPGSPNSPLTRHASSNSFRLNLSGTGRSHTPVRPASVQSGLSSATAHTDGCDTVPSGASAPAFLPLLSVLVGLQVSPSLGMNVHGKSSGGGGHYGATGGATGTTARAASNSRNDGAASSRTGASDGGSTTSRGRRSSRAGSIVSLGLDEVPVQWEGLPVRGLTVIASEELNCIASTGDDGSMVLTSLDGSTLARINAGTGLVRKRQALEPAAEDAVGLITTSRSSTDGGDSTDEAPATARSGSCSFCTASSPALAGSLEKGAASTLLSAMQPPIRHDAGFCTCAGGGDAQGTTSRSSGDLQPSASPRAPSAAFPTGRGQNPAVAGSRRAGQNYWNVPVDREARQTALAASAFGVMKELEDGAQRTADVDTAIRQGSVSNLGYEAVKEVEKRRRRSSIVASSLYLDPGERAQKAVLLATRSSTGSTTEAVRADTPPGADVTEYVVDTASGGAPPAAGAEMDGRFKLIAQLLGLKTWKDSATEKAILAAKQDAARVVRPPGHSRAPADSSSSATDAATSVTEGMGRVGTARVSMRGAGSAVGGPRAAAANPSKAAPGPVSDDPAVCTLAELAAAESDELAHRRESGHGSSAGNEAARAGGQHTAAPAAGIKAHRAGGAAGGDGATGPDGDSEGEEDALAPGARSDDEDRPPAITVGDLHRSVQLAKQFAHSALDSGEIPTLLLPGGIRIEDPAKLQRDSAEHARQAFLYPGYVAERARLPVGSNEKSRAERVLARSAQVLAEPSFVAAPALLAVGTTVTRRAQSGYRRAAAAGAREQPGDRDKRPSGAAGQQVPRPRSGSVASESPRSVPGGEELLLSSRQDEESDVRPLSAEVGVEGAGGSEGGVLKLSAPTLELLASTTPHPFHRRPGTGNQLSRVDDILTSIQDLQEGRSRGGHGAAREQLQVPAAGSCADTVPTGSRAGVISGADLDRDEEDSDEDQRAGDAAAPSRMGSVAALLMRNSQLSKQIREHQQASLDVHGVGGPPLESIGLDTIADSYLSVFELDAKGHRHSSGRRGAAAATITAQPNGAPVERGRLSAGRSSSSATSLRRFSYVPSPPLPRMDGVATGTAVVSSEPPIISGVTAPRTPVATACPSPGKLLPSTQGAGLPCGAPSPLPSNAVSAAEKWRARTLESRTNPANPESAGGVRPVSQGQHSRFAAGAAKRSAGPVRTGAAAAAAAAGDSVKLRGASATSRAGLRPPSSGAVRPLAPSPPVPPSQPAKHRRKARAAVVLVDKDWSEKLTAEEYAVLCRRKKVGGEPKRDVIAFRDMCNRIDRDGSGDISFDEFMMEVESGVSGVQHMRRMLEGMFRAADLDGSGSLSLWEFARVMMPLATPAALIEILAFVTYDGPALEPVVKKKVYHPDTVAQLKGLFELYDTDGSGTIDRDELRAALQTIMASFAAPEADLEGNGPSAAALQQASAREEAFFASIDRSGDQEIEFSQFCTLMAPYFEGC